MINKFKDYIKESKSPYQKISGGEYLKLKFLDKPVNVEDNHINYILNKLFYKLIDHKIVRFYIIPEKDVTPQFSTRKVSAKKSLKLTYDDGDIFLEININQLDDEYFLVILFNKEGVDRHTRIREIGEEEFYKCDQIYGLETLLKDKGII